MLYPYIKPIRFGVGKPLNVSCLSKTLLSTEQAVLSERFQQKGFTYTWYIQRLSESEWNLQSYIQYFIDVTRRAGMAYQNISLIVLFCSLHKWWVTLGFCLLGFSRAWVLSWLSRTERPSFTRGINIWGWGIEWVHEVGEPRPAAACRKQAIVQQQKFFS
jgi:hypothetical protein